MTIRQTLPKDFKGFYDINLQADEYHRIAVPSKFRQSPKNIDYELFIFNRFSDFIADENCIFLVAIEEERENVMGYLIALKKQVPDYPILIPRQYILIDNMGVHENFRQKGIGSRLLQRIEIEAKKAEILEIELNVYNFNEAGKKLYAKNGFEPMMVRMRRIIE